MTKEFFERLNKAIYDADMFDSELERKCDLTKGTIYVYRNGKTDPSLEKFAKLCKGLNVSADYLLFGKERE